MPPDAHGGRVPAVVNVCFHGIGTPRRELEPGEERYWVEPDEFLRVLDLVAEDPRVRLSFDDGNASDVEIALPALLERGLTATFYVIAGRLDRRGSLDSAELLHLADRGMQVGVHGMDHRPWRGLSDAEADRELVDARRLIEQTIGRPVSTAALPLGRYDRRTLARLRALGYEDVGSSDRRWGRDGGWLQPRFSVCADDTVETVRSSVLRPAPLHRRLRSTAVGVVKRVR
ncbi:glycosyl transferase family 2 [Nocardioides sp. Root1257]|nr:glycosyl transferase family 2 [Nocardioides sp. Root1257]KRC48012.1 glycosyl transferase family 2 [Nocardioides sp. Root224]